MGIIDKLRPGGKRLEKLQRAVDSVNGYLQKFDAKITEKPRNIGKEGFLARTKFTYRNITMEVMVLLPDGKTSVDLMLSAAVRQPPPGTNLLPIYQQLLLWNNLMTGITHFSIDNRGIIFMVHRRPLRGLDYEELEHSIVALSENTAAALGLLRQKFNV